MSTRNLMKSTEKSEVTEAVKKALNDIHDPCSVAAGHPLGLVDMGLVQKLEVSDEGSVNVVLRMTFAGCMMIPHLAGAAEESIAIIPGVTSSFVDVDTAITWTPSDMKQRPVPIPSPVSRVYHTLESIRDSIKEVQK